jgi:hypothetical protein
MATSKQKAIHLEQTSMEYLLVEMFKTSHTAKQSQQLDLDVWQQLMPNDG